MAEDHARLPAETTVGRVTLRVNDLDRLTEFYETVVGLTVQTRSDARTILGAGGSPLLELVADPAAPERGRTETGLFHTAFRVPNRAALGAALGRVETRWRLTGASDHLVSEALYLSDPEDNGVELYRDRPRAAWPTADGRVQMETLPLDTSDLREAARSTSGTGHETVPDETTVGHVHLEVSSPATAREFYVEALGLSVRQTYGSSALFLAAGDYHHHVGLNSWNGRTDPPAGRGLDWFELVVPDEATLRAARDRLDRRGCEPTARDGRVEVSDPDGIRLRLRAERG